jgi:hypothetical protein
MSLGRYFLGMDIKIDNLLGCHHMRIELKLNLCMNFLGSSTE